MGSPLLRETPKSQLTVEQPSTEKHGTYQKRYLTLKDKEEATRNGMRGDISIRSHPIPSMWVSHGLESNCTTEALPQE